MASGDQRAGDEGEWHYFTISLDLKLDGVYMGEVTDD